jgi:hypothetical protein
MQSEKKATKYIKAKDDSYQQQRALNNLIKVALADHKEVVDLAEVLLMLNLNTSSSVEMLLNLLEGEPANFNTGVGEDLVSELCKWLRKATNKKGKLRYKTPQTH